MYVRERPPNTLLLLALLLATSASAPARAQLIEGLAGWADSTVGLSTSKWRGARVPFPTPAERPRAELRIDSSHELVSVHGHGVAAERLLAVLAAAEATQELARAAGLLATAGDAGEGGTQQRDLYVVAQPEAGAAAFVDARGTLGALDGARAYAVLDARLPSERLFVCTAQALFDAELLELDPAEAPIVRTSVAAYFASLITGERGCDDGTQPETYTHDEPFASAEGGAAWLRRLAASRDRNRGSFVYDLWQFARQRTWEGRDLRASPDFFEALDKTLELAREKLSSVVSDLELARAREGESPVLRVVYEALPASIGKLELAPLASRALVIRMKRPQPGIRLRVWSRGDPGARFALAAERLDDADQPLARFDAPPLKSGTNQLSIELDGHTHSVLVSVTNLGNGIPDFDPPLATHEVAFTLDHVP